jgi:plastocyanin
VKNFLLAAACAVLCSSVLTADDWGSIEGQIIVDGDIPEPVLIHTKGAPIKDAAVCATADLFENDLLIDEDSKGLANAFVFMYRKPKKIHPDLVTPSKDKVTFDQKGCMFVPHCLLVRAGQTVEVLSGDPIAHNTHTYPIRGTQNNILVAPGVREGSGVNISCPVGESMPHPVKCDYHTWMSAHWLVLDHPYAAITDATGKFKIENLPVGKHDFRIWHERKGWLDRKYKVTVTADEVTELKPVVVPVADLAKK